MKLIIDLPDWAKGRNMRIFAGIEEVAHKYVDKPWMIKTTRCDMCGKCCMDVTDQWKYGKDEKTGWCKRLIHYANEYRCGSIGGRPFYCSAGDSADEDYCCIEWKVVDENVNQTST
jgi:hypothetical protein